MSIILYKNEKKIYINRPLYRNEENKIWAVKFYLSKNLSLTILNSDVYLNFYFFNNSKILLYGNIYLSLKKIIKRLNINKFKFNFFSKSVKIN